MTLPGLGDEFLGEFLALVVLGLVDASVREQVVGKVGRGVAVLFRDVRALEDFRECREDDSQDRTRFSFPR